ncbi:hypothetical protein [Mycolicibacterium sp. XJ870]
MSSFLQVNLDAVRATAHAEAQVGGEVSRTDAGAPLAAAASAMAGLRSAEGCRFAGTSFDAVITQASGELAEHSDSLLRAVRKYEERDAESGQQLTKIMELK